MTDVKDTLNDRGKTHGKFSDNADLTVILRYELRRAPGWKRISNVQQLVLDEIMLKVARILSEGAPVTFSEPWHDIAGYATLAVQEIENGEIT